MTREGGCLRGSVCGTTKRRIVVYPAQEAFSLKNGVEAMPLASLGKTLLDLA
jgi:hypothetical protein